MDLGDITNHQYRKGNTEESAYFQGDAVSPVNNDLQCGQVAVTTHAFGSVIDVSVMGLLQMAQN